MVSLTVPSLEDGAFSGAGLDAARRVYWGLTVNVCSPEFSGGADPTGVKDSTAAIQAAVDFVHRAGGGTVVIPAGLFLVSWPFVRLYGYVNVVGAGPGATRLLVDNSKKHLVEEETGVFHTGSYNKRVEDRGLFHTAIRDLMIIGSLNSGVESRSSTGAYQHISTEHMGPKVWGVVYNTYLGTGPADPDSVHTISDLIIWDMAGGIALLGYDDQGCKLTNVRIRRTWKQGLLVGKPFDHPEAYEANPSGGNPYRRTGAADNKFTRMDVSGGNQARAGYAGIEVYTAQCMFEQCTSWYHGRGYAGSLNPAAGDKNIWNLSAVTTPTSQAKPGEVNPEMDRFRYVKDGAGWYISGTRNEFANCTSQETGGHGWVMVGALCTYSHCRGESASYYDTAKTAAAKTSEAASFLVTNWAWGTHLLGCIAQNAYKREQGARYGFYIQNYVQRLRIRDCFSQNMPYVNGQNDSDGEQHVVMPANPGANVVIQVEGQELSTLSSGGSGGSSSGGGPVATALVPAEVGSVVAHWDFSDSAKVTVENGRVASVAPVAGSGDLVQADAAKRPYVSALSGRAAMKTKRAESLFVQAANIGDMAAGAGYTVALVGAVNSKTNAQYWVSAGNSSNPLSVTSTSGLAVRANSGGGSAGTTAVSADGSLGLYTPAVIVMAVTGETVTVWVNGAKTVQGKEAKKIASLTGLFTLGAYRTGGSDGADVTFGEAVVFSKTVSDDEAQGLTAYLAGKWG